MSISPYAHSLYARYCRQGRSSESIHRLLLVAGVIQNNAVSATAERCENGGASVGVRNPTQPVIGVPRGGCKNSTRASRRFFGVTHD